MYVTSKQLFFVPIFRKSLPDFLYMDCKSVFLTMHNNLLFISAHITPTSVILYKPWPPQSHYMLSFTGVHIWNEDKQVLIIIYY